jgi:hypothetical protein
LTVPALELDRIVDRDNLLSSPSTFVSISFGPTPVFEGIGGGKMSVGTCGGGSENGLLSVSFCVLKVRGNTPSLLDNEYSEAVSDPVLRLSVLGMKSGTGFLEAVDLPDDVDDVDIRLDAFDATESDLASPTTDGSTACPGISNGFI